MKNELILIIGIPGSGKSWLARILETAYQGEVVRIWDQPNLESMMAVTLIKDHMQTVGHAIVICNLVTSKQLQLLAPDRVYSIALRGNHG